MMMTSRVRLKAPSLRKVFPVFVETYEAGWVWGGRGLISLNRDPGSDHFLILALVLVPTIPVALLGMKYLYKRNPP